MAGSLNKVTLIGNLGADPDIRSMQSGDQVANLSIATTESWKDKNSGEKREKTEWHRVVLFSQGLVKVAQNYLKKGSKVYIEGQLETRSWEQDGQKKYTTEIVMRPYGSTLIMLDSRGGAQGGGQQGGYSQNTGYNNNAPQQSQPAPAPVEDFDDEIPF